MKKLFVIGILVLACWPGLLSFTAEPLTGTPASKAALGKKLFFEKILSKDSSVSCSSCHNPDYGFADTAAFSKGIGGKLTSRNTPSVLNMKFRPIFFWDGRAASLEQQALMPIQNPDEMGLPVAEAVARLNASESYTALFYRAYGKKPSAATLGAALAAFERTLETADSRYDDWTDDKIKFTAAEERGRVLFTGSKAKCFDCHFTGDFTADEFRNIGLYTGNTLTDPGRYAITGKKADLGKFKTPGLRNIAVTAPYMHNGMFKTLEEVIAYYNNPEQFVKGSLNADPLLRKPLGLNKREMADLAAFMRTLTDRRFLPARK